MQPILFEVTSLLCFLHGFPSGLENVQLYESVNHNVLIAKSSVGLVSGKWGHGRSPYVAITCPSGLEIVQLYESVNTMF